jgi:hypothetical protein
MGMSDAEKLSKMLDDATAAATEAYRAWERNQSDLLRSDYRTAEKDVERIEALLVAARRMQKGGI